MTSMKRLSCAVAAVVTAAFLLMAPLTSASASVDAAGARGICELFPYFPGCPR